MPVGDEVIGDLAQSVLTARALEPGHGEAGADGHTHESACLNCGTQLVGSHCHQCGQAAHVHRTIGAFFHDFLHGVFHFEGKIWRTLPALALRPGKLTREYVDGRRASYVSPIALFLFAVFLLFAVVKSVHFDFGGNADIDVNGKHVRGLEANRAEVSRLEKQRDILLAAGKPTAAIDGEIEGRKGAIDQIEAINDPLRAARKDLAKEAKPQTQAFETDIPAFADMARSLRENPQLALYQLQNNAYKFAWALIPISVPFVWLLFALRRRYGLYDHTVFVTYSLSFMLLLTALLACLGALGLPGVAMALTLIPPLHIYKQTRQAYGLTRVQALWRTSALCVYGFCALGIFLLLLLAMG